MKVLLVIGTARKGGAEGQLTRLAAELRRTGVDVRVAFLDSGGPLTARLDEAGVPWQAYGYRGLSLSRAVRAPDLSVGGMTGLLRLRAAIWRWAPDVVHAWLPHAVIAALVGSRRPVRIVAFRGQVLPGELGVLSAGYVRAVRRATAVTVNSPALVADYAVPWGADPDRITLIPNGIDVVGPTADPTRQPPVAAVVANFLPYKGHAALIDALALVTVPLCVRLYGAPSGGHLDHLRRRIDALALRDRVEVVEGQDDVRAELTQAQFAIHPSLTEGLSNAILEELAAGLPVIATRVGGNPTLVSPGVNGDLVPPDDPVALAGAIERMAADVPYRAALAAGARPSIERFSWAACTRAHLALYDRLVREQR